MAGQGDLIEKFQQPGIRAVVAHFDLLIDDSPLPLHQLRGEPGGEDHFQQLTEVFRRVPGGLHIEGGAAAAGEGVGIAAEGGKALIRAAAGQIEELVLQIVGGSGRGGAVRAVPAPVKIRGPVIDRDHGEAALEVRLVQDQDAEAVGKHLLPDLLPQPGVVSAPHVSAPFSK